MSRKGVVLAAGLGTRLHPMTKAVNKQLIPVYDKPMIYYALWVLLEAGVRDIMLVTSEDARESFVRLLGDGSRWGARIVCAVQPEPKGLVDAFMHAEDFIAGDPSMLVLGDNMFYGEGLADMLHRAAARQEGATVFGARVKDPERFGVASFDANGRVLTLEEKPKQPKSDCAVVGLYFYDGRVMDYAKALRARTDADKEVSITDVNRMYMEQGALSLNVFPEGFAWLDSGTHDSLLEAANFVAETQRRLGRMICCPEEAAWRQGFISAQKLREYGAADANNIYGRYLTQLFESIQ
ncbi:MAG: glucose-1-phosphate thymidylyltransferase RfbA [Pyramidobacter sp.]|nr:glucose-1-phosphate thymidylyltransferase RfbA [Pyramidobacter sp.]